MNVIGVDAEGFHVVEGDSVMSVMKWAEENKFTGKVLRKSDATLADRFCCKLKLWFKGGKLHREDGPAFMRVEGEHIADYWYWEGKDGLDNFPDDVLAKLGDQVI